MGREFGSHVAGQCGSGPIERLHHLKARLGPERPSQGGPLTRRQAGAGCWCEASVPPREPLRLAVLSRAGLRGRGGGCKPCVPPHCLVPQTSPEPPWKGLHAGVGAWVTRAILESDGHEICAPVPGCERTNCPARCVCVRRASSGARGILPCISADFCLPKGQGPLTMSALPRDLSLASRPGCASGRLSSLAWMPLFIPKASLC